METRGERAAWLGATLAFCLFSSWIMFGIGGSAVTMAFDDIGLVIIPAAAGVLCIMSARRESGPTRMGWRLIGVGLLSWAAGQATWSVYELGLGVEVPFPSAADIGFLLAIPFAAAGIVMFATGETGAVSRAKPLLDGVIIALGLFVVSWSIVLGPIYHASGTSNVEKAISLAYPIGDIVLATAVLAVGGSRPRGQRLQWFVTAAGFLVWGIADSGFALLTTLGLYSTGNLIDAAWAAGFLLIGLASTKRPEASDTFQVRTAAPVASYGLPYIPVVLALTAGAAQQIVLGALEPTLVWSGICMVLLVSARQLSTHVEIRDLTLDLQSSNARLAEHRELLETAQAISVTGSWEWNLVTDATVWSSELYHLYGARPETTPPSYANYLALVTDEDRTSVDAVVQQALRQGGRFDLHHRIRRPDGEIRILHCRGEVHSEAGRRTRLIGTAQDVTEIKRAEEALERSRELLADAERMAGRGSWEWDVEGHQVHWSPGLFAVYGVQPSTFRVTTESILELVHPGDRVRVSKVLVKAIEDPGPFRQSYRIVRGGADVRWLEVQGDVKLGPAGRPARVVGVVQDITERRRAEDERDARLRQEQELGRLRQENEFKTRFINTAAHELNTPLTPIRLQTHMLLHSPAAQTSPHVLRSAQILDRNVERLSRLVQDVLDATRLQAGRLVVRPEATDIDEVLAEVVESYTDPAREAGVSLDYAPSMSPIQALADPMRISQVVSNLVANAIKFSPAPGRVKVSCAVRLDGIEVAVIDKGRGIPADGIAKLFQPFTQLPIAEGDIHQGTGLGLFICKGIVEAHGGQIMCESPGLGHGSTFRFTIPAPAKAEGPLLAVAPKPASMAMEERIRRLL